MAFSQSGETSDVINAVNKAREEDIPVLAITNSSLSTLSKKADHVIPLNVGPEVSILASKSFIAQLLITVKTYAEIMEPELIGELKKVPKNIRDLLDMRYKPVWKKMVEEPLIWMAPPPFKPIVDEAAYRTLVWAGKPSWTTEAHEFKHGPIAAADNHHLFMVLNPNSHDYEYVEDQIQKIPKKVVVSDIEGDIALPDSHPLVEAIYGGVVLQWITYKMARYLRVDVDKPPHMSKFIMVE